MIVRARPKFYYQKPNNVSSNRYLQDNEEFFFNSGRSGLKFLLQEYSKHLGRGITVGMQSFNCEVVYLAACEANAAILLMDINPNYFSITAKDLSRIIQDIDVLLLTHYQGIPNQEYVAIVDLCNKNNVLLVDDLAQTEGSKIDGVTVGDISDFSIHSYAFDKPFSCYKGGSIKVRRFCDKEFISHLKNSYDGLPFENRRLMRSHLRLNDYLIQFTKEENYNQNYDNRSYLETFFLFFKHEKKMPIVPNIFFIKVIQKIFAKISNNKITIRRIQKDKIDLIKAQDESSINTNAAEEKLLNVISKLEKIPHLEGVVVWNRYSLMDPKNRIKSKLRGLNWQVSNFNWPICLHQLGSTNKIINIKSEFPQSEYSSKHVINIPIWHLMD